MTESTALNTMKDCSHETASIKRARRRWRTRNTTSIKSITTLILTLLLLAPTPTNAGLSIGGVTSTSSCYAALQNAKSDASNVVDKEGYVNLINELSNNAFTSFQENKELNEWGQFPVQIFDELPTAIKNEFYTHACGGPFVICQAAFLYTDGTGGNPNLDNPQQEVYLFQICQGIEEAIMVAESVNTPPTAPTPSVPTPAVPAVTNKPTSPPPPTYTPTNDPPPTSNPVEPTTFSGDLPLQLTYLAAVSSSVSTEELQLANSTTRGSLLGAMNAWSFLTAKSDFENGSVRQIGQRGGRRLRSRHLRLHGGRRRRELLVVPIPMLETNGEQYMDIIDVECNPGLLTSLIQEGDHCIQITTNLTLQLNNEPIGSQNETMRFFTYEFQESLLDGSYYSMIQPDETRAEFRAVSPVPVTGAVVIEDVTDSDSSATGPTPKPTTSFVDRVIGANPDQGEEEPSSSNIGGIIGGIVGGLLFVGIAGFFVYRRKQSQYKDDFSSHSGSGKKRNFDPANDLDGGAVNSSRDEFSSGESQSSGSMQSYSGSDSSSRSSRSSHSSGSRSSKSSRSSYSGTTRSGTSKSYTSSSYASSNNGGDGPASVSASESGKSSSSSNTGSLSNQNKDDDPNSPVDGNEGGAERILDNAATLGRRSPSPDSHYSASSQHSGSLYSIHEQDSKGSNDSSVEMASDPNMNIDDAHGSTGSQSRGSKSRSTGDSSESYRANVDLIGDQDSNQDFASKGTSATPTDDDSSAGSSGWDSSDGNSSVDTGSVSSYDPNTLHKSDLSSSAMSSGGDESTLDDSEQIRRAEEMVNPSVNPVVQRGVTMIPIEDDQQQLDDSDSALLSGTTGSTPDQSPMGNEIQEAIEKGDWAAVGATAAILASSDSSNASSVEQEENATRGSSVGTMSIVSTTEEDDIRAAEIDQLVENGNWDGVVAVAARYADEADEADDQLGLPLRSKHVGIGSKSSASKSSASKTSTLGSMASKNDAEGSDGSVSVETADASSVYSNTDVSSVHSNTTYSADTYLDDMTTSGSGSHTRPNDSDSMGSSITSSYVSGGGITESMVSAVSSVDQSEKRQMNAYRAEVEALVRRVVPDEIDNVDDIMVQFSGREEELIETLRAMQEKSIAQRARAAVQRSAKREAGGRTGRDTMDDESSEGFGLSISTEGQSVTTDGGQSMTTDGQSVTTDGQSVTTDGRTTRSGSESDRGDSVTEQFTEADADDFSTSSSGSSGSGTMSSYSSVISDSRSGVTGSEYSASQFSGSHYSGSMGMTSANKSEHGNDIVSDAIDASDWRAVGAAAKHLEGDGVSSTPSGTTGMSKDNGLDDMIDEGNWTGIIKSASNMVNSKGIADDDLD